MDTVGDGEESPLASDWIEIYDDDADEMLHHATMKSGPLDCDPRPLDYLKAYDTARVFTNKDRSRGRIIFDDIPYTFSLKDLPQ